MRILDPSPSITLTLLVSVIQSSTLKDTSLAAPDCSLAWQDARPISDLSSHIPPAVSPTKRVMALRFSGTPPCDMPPPSSSLSSPSSSASHLPTPQYPLPLTHASRYHTYRHGALHLVPGTVDQYFELPFGNEDKYELVQGILWCKGEMVTHTHDETRDRIAAELSRNHGDRGYEVLTERTVDASSSSRGASIRYRLRSSSASSRRQHSYTIRRPDIAVFQPGRAPNRHTLSPKSKTFTFPRDYPPLLAIEITSPSTRDVDLTSKWDEYEKAAIQCYVIVDRADESNPSVIVGTLSNGRYTRIVYSGDDVVSGLLFDELQFSAQYLLDPPRSITEIRNSPLRKKDRTIRDKDRTIRDKDRALHEARSDLDRTRRDNERTTRDKDRALHEALRDKDRARSDLDLVRRDLDRTRSYLDRTVKDKDRTISDLTRQLATEREQKKTSSKAHWSSGKQSASSSSPSGSASKGHLPTEGESPSKSPKNKKSKVKK